LSYTRIIKDSFIWGIWGVGVKDFLSIRDGVICFRL